MATRETIVKSLRSILSGKKLFNEEINLIEGQILGELPITSREKEVFILTLQGLTLNQIAKQLHISLRTVENHRRNISQ